MLSLFVMSVSFVLSLGTVYTDVGFQTMGDVFQYTPLFLLTYALSQKNMKGAAELACASIVSFLIMRSIKTVAVYMQGYVSEAYAFIFQRPDTGTFDGFPSGHTTACFVGSGYMFKKYGFFYAIPLFLIGVLVGSSRIYAQRHTLLQVCAGAALGFSIGYVMTSSSGLRRPARGAGIHDLPCYKR